MHSQARGQPEPEQRTCRSAHYRPPSSARATGPASTTAGHCIHKPASIAFPSPRAARTRTAHMQISTLSPTEFCSGITGPVSATARHCIHKPAGSPNQNSAHADQHIIAHRALLVPLGQSAPQLGIAFTSPRAARTRTAHMQISTLSPTELCSCHWASQHHSWALHSQARGQPEPEQRTCRSAHYRPPSSAQVSLGQSAPQLGIAFTSPRAARTRTAHMQISTLSPTELCSCHWASQHHSWALHSQARGQPEPEQRTCRSAHYRPPSSARATGPDSATARHCIHKPAGSPNQNSAHADQHIIAHRALLWYH